MATGRRAVGTLILAIAAAGCGDDSCTTCVEGAIRGYALFSDGTAIDGARVEVFGKPAVLTGNDGSFVVVGVDSSYDIALVQPPAPVQVWRGLTRRDPMLFSFVPPTLETVVARVSGHVPAARDRTTLVFFVASGLRRSTVASPFDGQYDLDVEWTPGVPAHAGQLCVLRWGYLSGQPSDYDGWTALELTLAAGAEVVQEFVAADLEDPRDATIAGHLDFPEGHTLDDLFLVMELGEQQVQIDNAFRAVDGNGDFELTVPDLPSTTFDVVARSEAFQGASSGVSQAIASALHPGTQGIHIRLESPPQLGVPAPAAADVDATTIFSWTPGSGEGIYRFTISPGPPFENVLYLLQTDDSLVLEEIPTTVYRPATDAPHTWNVLQLLRIPDTDHAAAEPGITPALFAQQDYTASWGRPFRTRP